MTVAALSTSSQEPEILIPATRPSQPPLTAAAPTISSLRQPRSAGSSNIRRLPTLFGSQPQNLSLQGPQVTAKRSFGEVVRRLGSQSSAPQRTEPSSDLSRRTSSYTASGGRQYSRADSSKWINSDTLLALEQASEESELSSAYRSYYQSSASEKSSNSKKVSKKTSASQATGLNEESVSKGQTTANFERAQVRREERRAQRESRLIQAFQPLSVEPNRPVLTEEEKNARFARSLSRHRPDPDPAATTRAKFLRLSDRPRNSLEEAEFLALCAERNQDGTLRHQAIPDEVQSFESDLQRRISRPLVHRRPDPDPAATARARRHNQGLIENFEEEEEESNIIQNLQASIVSTRESIRGFQGPATFNPVRQVQVPTAVYRARELPEPSAPNPAECDRLRHHTREPQSNRIIYTESPVSRGARTFGHDSLLRAPRVDSTTSSLRPPQGWSQNSSSGSREPIASSRLRQPLPPTSSSSHPTSSLSHRPLNIPVATARRVTFNIPSINSQSNSTSQGSSSGARLPISGVTVTPGRSILPPSQLSSSRR